MNATTINKVILAAVLTMTVLTAGAANGGGFKAARRSIFTREMLGRMLAANQQAVVSSDAAGRADKNCAKAAHRVESVVEDVLVEEDFSKFTSGSCTAPDTTHILAYAYDAPGMLIDPTLTSDGQWAGHYVYSAGGAVGLQTKNPQDPAYLITPLGDYSGEITVTFRVRAITTKILGSDGNTYTLTSSPIDVFAYVGGYFNPEVSDNDDAGGFEQNLYPKQGWAEVSYTFKNKSADKDGYIIFSTCAGVVIDDVKIKARYSEIAQPKMRAITDFKKDGFTINWDPVRKAYNYYVDLYKMHYTTDTDVAYNADFNDSSLPDGWTVASKELYSESNEGADGTVALKLRNGYKLTSPSNNTKFKSANMWFKVVNPNNGSLDNALINIDVMKQNGSWIDFGSFDPNYFVGDGESFDLNEMAEGLFNNNYYGIRIRPTGLPTGAYLLVDNIAIQAGRSGELERVFGSKSADLEDPYKFYDVADEGSYTFTDLDPETEYYYAVRSHFMDLWSKSDTYHAFGVATPDVAKATDIDAAEGSYTANWIAAPKADSYTVYNYGVYTAQKDETAHVILKDDFSKVNADVTEATSYSDLEALGNDVVTTFDEVTEQPGWTGVTNAAAQGMLGCAKITTTLPYLETPIMYLANNDKYNVYLKAYGYPGDQLIITTTKANYALDFVAGDDNATGVIDGLFTFEGGSADEQLLFSTYNCLPFALDEIAVTQDVKKGDRVYTLLGQQMVDGDKTSCTFTDLESDGEYAYNVMSHFTFDGSSTASTPSGYMLVDMKSGTSTNGIVSPAGNTSEAKVVARYNAAGQKIDHAQKGLNILRMSDGSVRKVVVK